MVDDEEEDGPDSRKLDREEAGALVLVFRCPDIGTWDLLAGLGTSELDDL